MSAIAPRGPHGHVRFRAWLHAHWLLARAGVAELVDALVLGTSIVRCGGSSPFARTNRNRRAEADGWKDLSRKRPNLLKEDFEQGFDQGNEDR